jgi:hypothetical protein
MKRTVRAGPEYLQFVANGEETINLALLQNNKGLLKGDSSKEREKKRIISGGSRRTFIRNELGLVQLIRRFFNLWTLHP